MNIRELTSSDLDKVCEMEREIFSDPWSRQSFEECLKRPHVITLVIEDKEDICGYCCLYDLAGEGEIVNIAVSPECRGKGYGSLILQELLKQGIKRNVIIFYLEVRKSNAAAIHLYKKSGFEELAVRKGFYQKPPEDAIVMKKEINPEHP